MQVNPTVVPSGGPNAAVSGALLWPTLLNLTTLSPQAEALREQRERQQRETEPETGALSLGPQPTVEETLHSDERRLAPGSRAERRLADARWQREQVQRQEMFRRSLQAAAQASRRGEASTVNKAAPTKEATDGRPGPETAPRAGRSAAGGNDSETAKAQPEPVKAGEKPAGEAVRPEPPGERSVRPTVPGSEPRATWMGARLAAGAAQGTRAATLSNVGLRAAAPVSNAARSGGPAPAPAAPSASYARTQAKVDVTGPGKAAPKPAQFGKTEPNVQRILRVLRSQIGRDRAQATLRLDPPELGSIRMRLDLRREVLHLRIETQTPLAHRLLNEHVESLRQGLESAGLRLEHLEIRPPTATPEANSPDPAFAEPEDRTGYESPSDPETDHPASSGTEARPGESSEAPAPTRPDPTEPAAESLVNILA